MTNPNYAAEMLDVLLACTAPFNTEAITELEGISFDMKETYVASNRTVLLRVRTKTNLLDIPCDLCGKDGWPMAGKYPNISGVFPSGEAVTVSLVSLKRWCEQVPASPDETGKHIALDLDGTLLYPPKILQVLKAFELNNEHTALMTLSRDRMLLTSASTDALVAALVPAEGAIKCRCERYTPEVLEALGDLL